jgi:hypothetical protein
MSSANALAYFSVKSMRTKKSFLKTFFWKKFKLTKLVKKVSASAVKLFYSSLVPQQSKIERLFKEFFNRLVQYLRLSTGAML